MKEIKQDYHLKRKMELQDYHLKSKNGITRLSFKK
jgi:hypothetical protein